MPTPFGWAEMPLPQLLPFQANNLPSAVPVTRVRAFPEKVMQVILENGVIPVPLLAKGGDNVKVYYHVKQRAFYTYMRGSFPEWSKT